MKTHRYHHRSRRQRIVRHFNSINHAINSAIEKDPVAQRNLRQLWDKCRAGVLVEGSKTVNSIYLSILNEARRRLLPA